MSEDRERIAAEPCKCAKCSLCGGSGVYSGMHGCPDWSEPCEDCGGSGIDEACDRCQLLTEMDHD